LTNLDSDDIGTGRRQELVARRDDPGAQGEGHPGAGRLRHHGRTRTGSIWRPTSWRTELRSVLEAFRADEQSLEETGEAIRELIRSRASSRTDVADAIRKAYAELGDRYDTEDVDVAVRSSATAEDLPEASFAGQLESFLNVSGEDDLLDACRECFASLFTDRAIAYREEQGFGHMDIALSVGVQKMVRADLAGAGVAFTLDTESGFPDVVVIDAAWGLGENVVQGSSINPDRYTVYKPSLDDDDLDPIIGKALGGKAQKMVYADGGDEPTENVETDEEERRSFVLTDAEIRQLGRWCAAIEEYYDKPMDIEWAKDGEDEEIYIVQARPETVQSRAGGDLAHHLQPEGGGRPAGDGRERGPGHRRRQGQVIESADQIDEFEDDAILVTG
jgi:pyruvate, water dikinase